MHLPPDSLREPLRATRPTHESLFPSPLPLLLPLRCPPPQTPLLPPIHPSGSPILPIPPPSKGGVGIMDLELVRAARPTHLVHTCAKTCSPMQPERTEQRRARPAGGLVVAGCGMRHTGTDWRPRELGLWHGCNPLLRSPGSPDCPSLGPPQALFREHPMQPHLLCRLLG